MTISLINTGKRFNRDWIFRHINYKFIAGSHYAITGSNGSGKSTLLQLISGAIAPSEGSIIYQLTYEGEEIKDDVYKSISITAPYLELVEEMTLKEFLVFHSKFKPLLPAVTIEEIIQTLTLEAAADKQIRYFSSGMKQRVKLAQSIFSNTAVVLLDEPCTNLDADGIALYLRLVNDYCRNRLVIVSSNDEVEYSFCKKVIRVGDYK